MEFSTLVRSPFFRTILYTTKIKGSCGNFIEFFGYFYYSIIPQILQGFQITLFPAKKKFLRLTRFSFAFLRKIVYNIPVNKNFNLWRNKLCP